jgi:hypothetical protein
MSLAAVFPWWMRFIARNIKVVNDAQCGRPRQSCHRRKIDKDEQFQKEERRLLLWELSGILNVLLESDHHITTVELSIS